MKFLPPLLNVYFINFVLRNQVWCSTSGMWWNGRETLFYFVGFWNTQFWPNFQSPCRVFNKPFKVFFKKQQQQNINEIQNLHTLWDGRAMHFEGHFIGSSTQFGGGTRNLSRLYNLHPCPGSSRANSGKIRTFPNSNLQKYGMTFKHAKQVDIH